MSNISKRKKEGSRTKIKSMGHMEHKEFLKRITKTLYYGQLPDLPCLSLPVTEVSCAAWSAAQRGRSLRRLHVDAAARAARRACVSPCALVLALLYLERLQARNPRYLAAAQPADLFLVSLMVGNKFLQDDGEDDEVLCSEWAASGDLELKQLKKLEVEFLDAMDWNVFVSDNSFEGGLRWLEKRVALKQAQLHGFFTYSDLLAASDAAPLGELARALAAAALASVAGLLALVASTLVLAHASMPALQHLTTPAPVTQTYRDITATDYVPNSTMDSPVTEPQETEEILKCCAQWTRYQEASAPKKTWYDGVVTDWKPLWSRTSVLNWLYQSSLVDPMQRWLERMDEYADFFRLEDGGPLQHSGQCGEYARRTEQPRCVRQWLNLSKLGALVVSVADR